MRCLVLSLVLLVFSGPALAARTWLAITREAFTAALKPLADARRADGFDVVVSTAAPDKAIASLKQRPAYILLVGDDQGGAEDKSWYLRSPRRKLYRWRSVQRMQFAADAVLGDFDGDLVPEAPVGRLPVRTARQLQRIVARIIAFRNKKPSLEDLRMPAWGASPGYNPMIDSLAVSMALSTVESNAPRWVRPWMILSNPRHALCGPPEKQAAMFTGQLARGGSLAIMMGHASATGFFSMRSGRRGIWFTARDAAKGLAGGKVGPAMLIFACETGNFLGKGPCLGESLLLNEGGPVAVIAATTESHPMTNYFSGLSLLQSLGGKHKRLGDLWLAAQKKAMRARNPFIERMLRDVEGKLDDQINTTKLRRDQMLMYAILGDPATKLRLPERLRGKIRYEDGKWRWLVHRPKDTDVLHVDLRPAGGSFPTVDPAAGTDPAGLFAQADETFAFKPLSKLGANDNWRGAVGTEGILRLVAVGPKKIYAAAIKLKRPATRPAGGQVSQPKER